MDNTQNTVFIEDENVKKVLSILQESNNDIGGIAEIIKRAGSMESKLVKMAEELQTVKHELSLMQEERDHPLRTAMNKAIQSLEASVEHAHSRFNELKQSIIEICKNILASFKEKGVIALNDTAEFLKLKPALESLRDNIQSGIKSSHDSIAKVDAITTELNSAGRSFRNVGRVIAGKEVITDINPNGKLAKLASAPFRAEIKGLEGMLKSINKSVAALDSLQENAVKKTVSVEARTSVCETMKKLKLQVEQRRKDTPTIDKAKHVGAEL